MTVRVHPLGLGESLGDDLIINGPLVHTGQVWWVDSATGSDAVSPRGLERAKPLATLAQAVSNAAHGDVIVLMDGHVEVISVNVTIGKRLVIVGSGLSSGEPTVEFGVTGNIEMLSITGAQVELRNITFRARSTASAEVKVDAGGNGFKMVGCRFECGDNDTGTALRVSGDYTLVKSTTFVSTAVTTAPGPALVPIGVAGCRVEDCVFDGGTDGWTNGYAIDQNAASQNPSLDLRYENLTMLRGSDIRFVDGTIGYVLVNAGSYAPRIDWDGVTVG